MKKEIQLIQTTSSPSWQSQLGVFYLFGIFIFSLLSYHSDLLDHTLLPRYVCASFVFLFTTIFIGIKSISKNKDIYWPRMDWPTGLLLSYFTWCTISIFWATNFSEAIFESQKCILGFAAFYMCRWFQLNDVTFVSRLLKIIILVSGFVLILAFWQISQMNASAENAQYMIRGISGHKNLFSTVLFLLAGFLSLAYFKFENNWRKVAALLFIAILFLTLYLKTRSVYLGSIVVAIIFIFLTQRHRLRPKLASVLSKGTVALVMLGLLGFLYLLQTNQLIPLLHASKIDEFWQSDTGYERLILWEKTACVIRQSPIWGVGAGNWQIDYLNCGVFGLYSVELDATTFQRPHNDWLWVWAETGIIGLFCYLSFFLVILKAGLSNFKSKILNTNQLGALARYSFIAGFMIIACFSFPKERIEIILLIYTLIGMFYPVLPKPNIKSSAFTKLTLILIITISSLNLYICKQRIVGEKNMKNVLILKQQKKWSEMIDASNLAYSKWYTVDPTTIPIHWYRGTANFILGNQKLALRDFLKAKEYSPFNQHILNDLGTCYENYGQKEQARAYYKEAIRISPLFDDPRLNIGVSYYNDGQYEKALDWINSMRNNDLKIKYRKIIIDQQNNN